MCAVIIYVEKSAKTVDNMIWKATILVGLAACALGNGHDAYSEQQIVLHFSPEHRGHHGDLGHIGKEPEHHEEYAWAYPSYEFQYHVEDPHTHDFKGQREMRHGDEVKGEYWLLQPDGYKRVVNYHADKHTGFKADVKYEKVHEPMPHEPKHHIPHKPHVEHHVIVEHKEHKEEIPVVEEHHEEPREPERPSEPEERIPEVHHVPKVIENYHWSVHHPVHRHHAHEQEQREREEREREEREKEEREKEEREKEEREKEEREKEEREKEEREQREREEREREEREREEKHEQEKHERIEHWPRKVHWVDDHRKHHSVPEHHLPMITPAEHYRPHVREPHYHRRYSRHNSHKKQRKADAKPESKQ